MRKKGNRVAALRCHQGVTGFGKLLHVGAGSSIPSLCGREFSPQTNAPRQPQRQGWKERWSLLCASCVTLTRVPSAGRGFGTSTWVLGWVQPPHGVLGAPCRCLGATSGCSVGSSTLAQLCSPRGSGDAVPAVGRDVGVSGGGTERAWGCWGHQLSLSLLPSGNRGQRLCPGSAPGVELDEIGRAHV